MTSILSRQRNIIYGINSISSISPRDNDIGYFVMWSDGDIETRMGTGHFGPCGDGDTLAHRVTTT